ncbi:MAG: circularly permuted type 2 ATP-grasp protein [Hyphomonadaceae bacterium]|nr:circularly permuted type 2 ATP-grasp protein [Hyphomonadaceae bacterium]
MQPAPLTSLQAPAGYAPVAGAPDELLDESGNVRPVWRAFLDHFSALSPDDIASRFALGDQYLADSGVYFRHADGAVSRERSWPLSHVPVLIAEEEWTAIVAGLSHRADLLEALMRDVYGENALVAEGALPAQLLARNPEWVRPMLGVAPRSGSYLHFVSFELGRSPSGQWWVLNDRTQAPSGAGFALENRGATSRIFADFFPRANVRRLAGFFRSFRAHLDDLRSDGSAPPAILTPGPHADTYFEHAFTARYLGLLLVEGEDLVVEQGRPMVRTISGLKPIDVLWRRIDASFADPLELNEHSRIGTPGLIGALRQQGVTMINAVGSGVLETRALMAFLPRISERLTGEPLRLPNIATWWCGQEAERAHVRANIAAMTVSPAMSTRLSFDPDDMAALAGAMRTDAHTTIEDMLAAEGEALVGQEAVTLSTSPAYIDGALAPRPMTLRVFLARGRDGWFALPGGYARIGRSMDVTALGMHAGGSCTDVWVVADSAQPPDTMIQTSGRVVASDPSADLPSRAADNLFWLGRYVERAEYLARLKRAYDIRRAETIDSPLIDYLAGYLRFLGVEIADMPSSIVEAVRAAGLCAARLRDRLSPDGLVAITRIERFIDAEAAALPLAARMGELLRRMVGFSGLVHENMYRSLAWRFLSIGRALERAMTTASLVASLTHPDAPAGALEAALDCLDSRLVHQQKYGFSISPETVKALLCLDGANPRALMHQLSELKEHIAVLPGAIADTMSPTLKAVMQLHTRLAVQAPEELDAGGLLALRAELSALSDALAAAYLS